MIGVNINLSFTKMLEQATRFKTTFAAGQIENYVMQLADQGLFKDHGIPTYDNMDTEAVVEKGGFVLKAAWKKEGDDDWVDGHYVVVKTTVDAAQLEA